MNAVDSSNVVRKPQTFFFCRSDENVSFLCGAGRFIVVDQALHANELWNLSLVTLQCSSTGYPAWQLGATIFSDSPSLPFPTPSCLHSVGIELCHYDRCCASKHEFTILKAETVQARERRTKKE